jgi:hypothetical protein
LAQAVEEEWKSKNRTSLHAEIRLFFLVFSLFSITNLLLIIINLGKVFLLVPVQPSLLIMQFIY